MATVWHILKQSGDIIAVLLENRGLTTKKEVSEFLSPPKPDTLTAADVGIDATDLRRAVARIKKAITNKESIVVYADYDADGITAGAIMWETLHRLGATVMPYIPHRVEEGYGLSTKDIDAVRSQYDPSLIITVDHGITAVDKVSYAKKLGIDVIVTDHHVKPDKLPECTIVHTVELCGAGVSWFLAHQLGEADISLATIGTIADLVPLNGANRSIVKYGLSVLRKTDRVGLRALLSDAGIRPADISVYDVSHVLAPRLNAMGRLTHAMDALRLLCTNNVDRAGLLAKELGITNKERQQLTTETSLHARGIVSSKDALPTLLFVAHETYNQGVIGLVAGKLVEEYYRPAIVVAQGPEFSKASARSIHGFNIVEAIRKFKDLLVDVGGHPMAAGFTVETKKMDELKNRLEAYAQSHITEEMLKRVLRIDMEIPLSMVSEDLWHKLRDFEPFGLGSPEPVFATRGVTVADARLIGADGKHLKMRIGNLEAVAFGMGKLYPKVMLGTPIDIAYTIDMNVWNGTRKLQLKIKDIEFHEKTPPSK